MSDLKIKGKIVKILEVEKGTSKSLDNLNISDTENDDLPF